MFHFYNGFAINTAHMNYISIQEDLEMTDGSFIARAHMMSGNNLIIEDCMTNKDAIALKEQLLDAHSHLKKEDDIIISNSSNKVLFYKKPNIDQDNIKDFENLAKLDGISHAKVKDGRIILGIAKNDFVNIKLIGSFDDVEAEIKKIVDAINNHLTKN